jgi:hypothetical protein
MKTYSLRNVDTLPFKEASCLVGDFLIRLTLLYGVDLAATKLPLKSIDTWE